MEPQLGHLPAAKHFHCSTETLPILLSLMRETAAAPGLVTQEPGKSVAWGGLNSPPVMHDDGGHIYNVCSANVCTHKHWSHAGLPYLRGVTHPPSVSSGPDLMICKIQD